MIIDILKECGDDIISRNAGQKIRNLILEQQPRINIINQSSEIVEPLIIKYEPNQAIFETNVNYNSLLFLSDAYDADWHAYIDGLRSDVLRTDYALRSVAVPAGNHRVVFKYEPKSQTWGIAITSLSLVAAIAAGFYWQRKKEI